MKKVASEEGRGELALSELGARTEVRGEVNLGPGVRRFGKSFRGMEDIIQGGRIYTLDQRVGAFLGFVCLSVFGTIIGPLWIFLGSLFNAVFIALLG